MIYDYEVQPHEDVPDAVDQNPEAEFFNAKAFLQTASTDTGDNLYDHLTDVLNKILAERPQNVIDFFEEYSRKMKEKRFKPATDHLEDIYVPEARFKVATSLMPLLKPLAPMEPSTQDPEDLELADMSRNNTLELLYYFEQVGIGLPKQDMVYIMLSMRKLVHTEPIASIRFWGKIFGTLNNYIILETELKEEEYIKRNETFEEEVQTDLPAQILDIPKENDESLVKAYQEIAKRQELLGEGSKYPRPLPAEPKVQYEELPEPPSEPAGVGVNKKTYFVSNGIGDTWTELPNLTPKQIRVARQIYKSFTGHLEQEVSTYPEFPGKEKHYLRAQIARISAGTQIAPLGYYTFGAAIGGEGDEEEEDIEEAAGGESKTEYRINPKYEPPALKDLTDRSMAFWVHSGQYILPQGRTSWWNPSPVPDVDDEELGEELGEEEEEEGDRLKAPRVEPESGPPLLTPCSEDASLETVPAWSVRASSAVMESIAVAVVRSNLWPGAYCFSTQGKFFQNVYFGFGLKYMEHNFSPLPLPPVQQEYPVGPEILEITDPTGAEEEQWRIDHLPKPKVVAEEVGEEVEPEEPEEDEEDEDEDED